MPYSNQSVVASVASSASSVNLLERRGASGDLRKGAVIYNDSSAVLYVKLGATASTTSFTYYLAAGATLELPYSEAMYQGVIDGIWASATGSARITELI